MLNAKFYIYIQFFFNSYWPVVKQHCQSNQVIFNVQTLLYLLITETDT